MELQYPLPCHWSAGHQKGDGEGRGWQGQGGGQRTRGGWLVLQGVNDREEGAG